MQNGVAKFPGQFYTYILQMVTLQIILLFGCMMLVLAKYESALKRCDEVSGAVSALIFLSQSAKAVDRGRAEVDSRQTSNQGRGWVR